MTYITVGQENSATIDLYYEDLGGRSTDCSDSWISPQRTFLGKAGLSAAERRVSGNYLRSPRIWCF